MTPVLVSMRVDVHESRGERRDALDVRLCRFLLAAGGLPIPVPNVPEAVEPLAGAASPGAVVLSGGNDLAALGGDAPERDRTEACLVDAARARAIPVIGICRGMQFLTHRAGGAVTRLAGHAGGRHVIRGAVTRDVNSFHAWAVTECAPGWTAFATAGDGSIELAGCAGMNHWGLMWHPEREPAAHPDDVALFGRLLAGRGVAPTAV